MRISEVFPNPTVKQVIFQIRFPSLFYIESKVGELQLELMKDFPESDIIYRQHFVLVDAPTDGKAELPSDVEPPNTRKIWRFRSPRGCLLHLLADSLDIQSEHHKTYDLGDGERFRDVIELVLSAFLKVMPIPVITRIGLRYIDHCPIPAMDNEAFKSYYNTCLALRRFGLDVAREMEFKAVVRKGRHYLRYAESLKQSKEGPDHYLHLDFDAFSEGVAPEQCLAMTDELHQLVRREFERTIKQPVYDHMRQEGAAG